jgi:histidine triad (HIT) family protein
MESCIFCRIVRGDAPADRIHEDEHVVVFLDLFPAAEGHTLVVPKAHFENLFEADDESLRAVACTSRRIAHALRAVLGAPGLGVFQLNGAAAGQTVFHYHMHLVPRRQGEELHLHGRTRGDPAGMADLARRLQAELGPRRG